MPSQTFKIGVQVIVVDRPGTKVAIRNYLASVTHNQCCCTDNQSLSGKCRTQPVLLYRQPVLIWQVSHTTSAAVQTTSPYLASVTHNQCCCTDNQSLSGKCHTQPVLLYRQPVLIWQVSHVLLYRCTREVLIWQVVAHRPVPAVQTTSPYLASVTHNQCCWTDNQSRYAGSFRCTREVLGNRKDCLLRSSCTGFCTAKQLM